MDKQAQDASNTILFSADAATGDLNDQSTNSLLDKSLHVSYACTLARANNVRLKETCADRPHAPLSYDSGSGGRALNLYTS